MSEHRFYLGTPVLPVSPTEDGWIWAEWPDGRRFKHWEAQLLETPWGESQ